MLFFVSSRWAGLAPRALGADASEQECGLFFLFADVPGRSVQERLLPVSTHLKLNSKVTLMRLLIRQRRPFGFNGAMESVKRAVQNKPG